MNLQSKNVEKHFVGGKNNNFLWKTKKVARDSRILIKLKWSQQFLYLQLYTCHEDPDALRKTVLFICHNIIIKIRLLNIIKFQDKHLKFKYNIHIQINKSTQSIDYQFIASVWNFV